MSKPIKIFMWTYMVSMFLILTVGTFSACSEADTNKSREAKIQVAKAKDAGVKKVKDAEVKKTTVVENDLLKKEPVKDPKDPKDPKDEK